MLYYFSIRSCCFCIDVYLYYAYILAQEVALPRNPWQLNPISIQMAENDQHHKPKQQQQQKKYGGPGQPENQIAQKRENRRRKRQGKSTSSNQHTVVSSMVQQSKPSASTVKENEHPVVSSTVQQSKPSESMVMVKESTPPVPGEPMRVDINDIKTNSSANVWGASCRAGYKGFGKGGSLGIPTPLPCVVGSLPAEVEDNVSSFLGSPPPPRPPAPMKAYTEWQIDQMFGPNDSDYYKVLRGGYWNGKDWRDLVAGTSPSVYMCLFTCACLHVLVYMCLFTCFFTCVCLHVLFTNAHHHHIR